MLRRRALPAAPLALAFVLSACAGEASTSTTATTTATTTTDPREPRTCVAPGLERARPLAPLQLADCSFSVGGPAAQPSVLASAAQVEAALRCTGQLTPAAAAATLDLATHDVHVVTYTMSPAFGGIEVYDDGTRLTLLTRFRPSCPGDPLPMPVNATLAWLLPKRAARTLVEATCTLPEACD